MEKFASEEELEEEEDGKKKDDKMEELKALIDSSGKQKPFIISFFYAVFAVLIILLSSFAFIMFAFFALLLFLLFLISFFQGVYEIGKDIFQKIAKFARKRGSNEMSDL